MKLLFKLKFRRFEFFCPLSVGMESVGSASHCDMWLTLGSVRASR